MSLYSILLLIALMCFLAGTVGLTARINLVALGMALWVLALLLGGGR